MYEYASTLVREGLHAVGGFLAVVQSRIAGWIYGEDLSFVALLVVVALIILFVMVPNRRRY
jgi:hypothetical protein